MCGVLFLRLPKTLFYTPVSFCRVFKLFSFIWRRICRKSLNPSLSWLIVDVFVCLGVCSKGGGDLRGCQLPKDVWEHVRTREAEAPARLTDTILTCDAYTSQAQKQQHPQRNWQKHPGLRWHLIYHIIFETKSRRQEYSNLVYSLLYITMLI